MGDSLREKQKLPKTLPLRLAKGLDVMLQDKGGGRKGAEGYDNKGGIWGHIGLMSMGMEQPGL